MKKPTNDIAPIFALIVSLMLVVGGAGQAKPGINSLSSRSDSMTIWQARRTVVAGEWNLRQHLVDRSSIRFTADNFEFDAAGSKNRTLHFNVDLRNLEAVSIKCHAPWQNRNTWCELTGENGKHLQKSGSGVQWHAYYNSWYSPGDEPARQLICPAECVAAAKTFAVALNRLRAFANDTESPLRNFTPRAAAWRATAPKPPLPEDVRVLRLLAEDAVKQKNPGEALNRYETGLELYPTWPEGLFNAALIAAELGYYADAAEHMQAYLELVPDAQDSQSARDQIAIWQYKAKGK